MRLGRHCRAPPLAVQPSPAPTIRHGGEARRVGAGARRWADLQASVTSTGPVCGQTNPGGRGEIVVGAPQSADKSFFDESTSSVWQVVAKFVRPCISLSCCVTFLRATYVFKCCSQSLPAAGGARVRNPSVPGKFTSLTIVDSLVATPLPCCACSIAFCVVRFSITAAAAATASSSSRNESMC